MENPILSSLPNMSQSSSLATQGDVTSFFKHLRFDPKLVAAEHNSNHQVDLKRHVNVALGLPLDESSPSSKAKLVATPVPEEISRVKVGLNEGSVKARQRAKAFDDALSVFNKVFPSIPSKKRSRSECFSNDRSGVMLSDRSVLALSGGKAGVQGHAVTGGYELEQQKTEERAKNSVPNKCTRTSLVDVRMDVRTNSHVRSSGTVDRDKDMLRLANSSTVQGKERALALAGEVWERKMKRKRSCIKPDGSPSAANSHVRPSGTVDRDKDMLRLANSCAAQGKERALALAGEGWERKMKRKRSCIKPDGSPSAALTKPIDAFQESKQGIQRSNSHV